MPSESLDANFSKPPSNRQIDFGWVLGDCSEIFQRLSAYQRSLLYKLYHALNAEERALAYKAVVANRKAMQDRLRDVAGLLSYRPAEWIE